ncbi:MAG TPA: nuclear transport factor 2 family protein [Longimicrobium sp.]
MKTAFLAASLAAAALAAHPAAAQREMYGLGGSANDGRRQFEAEARQQVGALLADFESAWGSDDPRALTELYAGSATFYPAEGGMLTGRGSIRDYFARLLPKVEPVRTSVVEFKVSGDLAFATVQVAYKVRDAAGAERSFIGTDVFVLRKAWAAPWSIVSHYAKPESLAAPAAAATADTAGGAPRAAPDE